MPASTSPWKRPPSASWTRQDGLLPSRRCRPALRRSPPGSANTPVRSNAPAWRPAPWPYGFGTSCTIAACPSSASIDARYANAALKIRLNKTDRNDAVGLAQIVRTGWFKQVRIKTRASYQICSLLSAREALVRIRVKLENQIRGGLRTFGVLFGKAVGGFTRRATQIITEELDASPEMRLI